MSSKHSTVAYTATGVALVGLWLFVFMQYIAPFMEKHSGVVLPVMVGSLILLLAYAVGQMIKDWRDD